VTIEEVSEGEDDANIRHLENCDGCDRCDYLLEFYAGCDGCGHFGHISAMYGDGRGRTYCKGCWEERESRGKTQ